MYSYIIKILIGIVTVMTITFVGHLLTVTSLTDNLKNDGYRVVISSVNAAPEIDAASGTSAIALLTGVLLLAGERSWSKRSSKSEE